MWPKLSNINKDIYDKITNRNNLEASKLNCWVRLFSGVGDGLILVSNPDTKLFAAAGEGGIYGFAGNATESGYSGELGKDWNGKSVNPLPGRSLRPSPMVTSLEFSEGEDQISRSGKISLKVFSLEQMEIIQQFFMEPGYNLFVEWGWNTEDGVSGLVDTSQSSKIPGLASKGNLVQSAIRNKALNTNGDYDNMLGFIVGGAVGNDGENFSVEIELRGTPELPTYLQQQNVAYPTLKNGGGIISKEGSSPYPMGVLTESTKNKDDVNSIALDRRFATMFNSLPAHRQTQDVVDFKDKFTMYDFVNCDGLITENINNFLQGSFFDQLFGTGNKVEIQNFQIEKEKLFSKNKYIRLERAIDVIGASGLSSYISGDQTVSCTIDISDTKIGAFPLIYSTKPESLLIPGELPDFQKYYLTTDTPNYESIQRDKDGNKTTVNNSINGISFVQNTSSTKEHIEKGKYWGYLKNLYINEDMMVNKMVSKNKNIREVLYDILNELSSAVNSFWDFQIVEGKDKNDKLVLTVVDRNWVGQSPGKPKEFYHNGENSRFLSSALSIDIPGEMANQIISSRLGASVKTDGVNIETGTKRFFAKGVDRFMKSLNINGKNTDNEEAKGNNLRTIEGQEKQIADNKARIKDLTGSSEVERTYIPSGGYGMGTSISITTDENGNRLKTETNGRATYASTPEGQELKKLENENKDLKAKIDDTKKSNLSASVDKLDIVPNPAKVTSFEEGILSDDLIIQKDLKQSNLFSENFKFYTFKDTNLLDIIKNNSLLGKNTGRLSHPLPIKYTFTILGTSGIRRGDMFNIVGIPEKYKKYGLFQVNSVEHSIEGMRWETTIEGLYRQTQ